MIKVKDFLESQKADIDVLDDYDERLDIAYCVGEKLSSQGEKEFADVLEMEMSLYTDAAVVHVKNEHEAQRAMEMFYTLSGFCGAGTYDRLVEGA